jgi:glycosyltransferase involved in cell wall biosynthesis
MKIAIISDLWLPFPGGAERYVANVSQSLIDRGHECHVLTSYARAHNSHCSSITITDIGVRERHEHGLNIIGDFLHDIDADVALIHHFFDGEFPEVYTTVEGLKDIPVVQISHNRPRNPCAEFTLFNSEYTANRQNRQSNDLVILPAPGRDTVADGGSRDCIGHIKPQGGKGIELTYRLAQAMPDRPFLILRGEWQDGEMISNLPNVSYLEPLDDIRDFYSRCRIVLMPSISEDAGTVPQEAALNGIPCISSNVGGLPETNAGGILLNRDNFMDWYDEIYKLDQQSYYDDTVWAQRAALPDWTSLFNELDRRIRAL